MANQQKKTTHTDFGRAIEIRKLVKQNEWFALVEQLKLWMDELMKAHMDDSGDDDFTRGARQGRYRAYRRVAEIGEEMKKVAMTLNEASNKSEGVK